MLRLLELADDEGQRFKAQVDDLTVTGGIERDLMVWFNEAPEDGVEVIASASVTDQDGFLLLFSNRGDRIQTLEYVPFEGSVPDEWPNPDQLEPLRWES